MMLYFHFCFKYWILLQGCAISVILVLIVRIPVFIFQFISFTHNHVFHFSFLNKYLPNSLVLALKICILIKTGSSSFRICLSTWTKPNAFIPESPTIFKFVIKITNLPQFNSTVNNQNYWAGKVTPLHLQQKRDNG